MGENQKFWAEKNISQPIIIFLYYLLYFRPHPISCYVIRFFIQVYLCSDKNPYFLKMFLKAGVAIFYKMFFILTENLKKRLLYLLIAYNFFLIIYRIEKCLFTLCIDIIRTYIIYIITSYIIIFKINYHCLFVDILKNTLIY